MIYLIEIVYDNSNTLLHFLCSTFAVVSSLYLGVTIGAVQPESSGLGGGGFMTIRHSNGSVYTINFREKAPSKATEYMFHSNSSLSRNVSMASYVALLCMCVCMNFMYSLSFHEVIH